MSYHIRRKDREIDSKDNLFSIIKKCKYAVISVCHNNQPYIVTLSYGFDADNQTLYFHCAKEGKKIDFFKNNNKVCITIIEDNGYVKNTCEHEYRSIIIDGEMQFVQENTEKLRGINVFLDHYHESKEKLLMKIKTNSSTWINTQILKLKIDNITGKERNEKN